VTRDPI